MIAETKAGSETFPYSETGEDPSFCVGKRIDGSVDLVGEIDFFNAESFRSALSAAIPSSGIALINMRGLTFISSAGIRAIVSTASSFPAVEFRLISPNRTFVKCWGLLACSSLVSNMRLGADIAGREVA